MSFTFRRFLFLFKQMVCSALLFCYAPSLMATHIVGGEMTYTCLGDNLYEIQLVIYRDCFFGNPNAYFDDPASIGVFDQNNLLIQDIRIDLMNDDTLSQVLTNECLVIPPSVCVHTTIYQAIIELPPIIGGYQLAYQRCCRNQTIVNIVEPLATGATFGVNITERALLECNSSATFLQWPPLYICANEPIFFDQSATDIDGDSIVYRLCTPLQGADQEIPRPQPPNNPPYDEVVWNDPPYNTGNMLNGIPGEQVLQIDPVTGLLTGTPNTIGQFVVGICAEEYRDGELISTTRRDFQYNVGVCGQVTAAFFTPTIQCDGLEVSFENQSLGANQYQWFFGAFDNPLGTSTLPNPSFVFPDTGLYNITLIAEPGEFCADTFKQTVQLLPNSLIPAFDLDTLGCGDSLWLQLTDISTDSFSSLQSWEWSVNGVVFSQQPNPELLLTEEGSYEIHLLVTAENGCQKETVFAIDALTFIDEELVADTLFLCPGDSVFLHTDFNDDYTYEWSPSIFLDDPFAPNPLATPLVDTTYSLVITNPVDGCTVDRSIHVAITEQLLINLTEDIVSCANRILLEVSSNNGIRYIWASDPDFMNDVLEGTIYWASPIGQQTYYIQVINSAACVVIDSVSVNSQAVNINLPVRDTAVCLGESLLLSFEELDPDDDLSIVWSPEELILNGQNTTQVNVATQMIGEQFITYTAINQYGCQATDSIRLTVVDTVQLAANLFYQQCNGNRVQFVAEHPYAALYQWHFGDPAMPNAQATGAEVSYTYAEAGTYEVSLTLPAHLNCWDTLYLSVTVLADAPVNAAFSWEYLSCSDTALVVLTDATEVIGTQLIAWEWWLFDSLIGTENSTELIVYTNELQAIQLITFAENGCIDTLSQLIEIPLIPYELADSMLICANEAVFLYPDADVSYDYEWSPSTYLDDEFSPNPLAMPVEDIVYSVRITDPNSICEREGEIVIDVPPLIIYNLPADSVVCDVEFLLFAQSDQNLTYAWSTNPNFSPLLSEESEWLATLANGETVFYLNLTDEFGCNIIDSIVVNSQAIRLMIDPEQIICLGDTLQLEAIATGGENLTYQWSPSGSIIGADDTPTILVSPEVMTDYNLSISNDAACQIDSSIRVNVFNFRPPLLVTPEVDTLLPGESIQLTATNRPGYVYEWTPAQGLSEVDVFNPIARPEETTTYQLRIRDANGCTNTAEVLLIVFNSPCQRPFIFVPNAFTPNADQLNDYWGVEGNTIDELHLSIYNRWGELVFESFDQANKWDGSFKGQALPSDVYGYYLEVSCLGGERFVEKGNVSLIR